MAVAFKKTKVTESIVVTPEEEQKVWADFFEEFTYDLGDDEEDSEEADTDDEDDEPEEE